MIPFPTSHLLEVTRGELVNGSADTLIDQLSTDTRTLSKGATFVALIGESHDAHDHLQQAIDAGASALIVSRVPENLEKGHTTVVLVRDTLLALQQYASWYRNQLNITAIGITGSNGKTSTKDFTRSVLSQKFKVNATKGNLNNHIGLPLSVLSTEAEHEVCVWEMGMNHSGEIAPLCQICKPEIGIITNVGTAHIEFMGSREAIAEEKGELAKALPDNGTLILSAASDYTEYFNKITKAKTLIVGNGRGRIRAENLKIQPAGSTFDLVVDGEPTQAISLPVVGRHMVVNALLAAASGLIAGMTTEEIAKGLHATELTSGRLRQFEHQDITVFDDTYNANPESVAAAINSLHELSHDGHKHLALGAMAELGEHTDQAHYNVGKLAAQLNIPVISVGKAAERIAHGAHESGGIAVHFDDRDEATEFLRKTVKAGDVILFKGSRTAGMERIMNQLYTH